jgi:hypothetical protein
MSTRRRDGEVILLPLKPDGRLAHPGGIEIFEDRLARATDCFVFCHGWLYEQVEARDEATRFFALLDTALRPLGDRVVPLRLAIHWPSKPFAEPTTGRHSAGDQVSPGLAGGLGDLARTDPGLLSQLLAALVEAEVPLGPEEELELDALVRQVRGDARRGRPMLSPLHALSFWLMKRRAGQVGERLGREVLAPLFTMLGDRRPRLHLIGHSFGAKLVASSVLGGLRPESLVLLLAAFSAFAFAEDVPGTKGAGFYRRVVTDQLVGGPIVALRSDHDRALGTLYPAVTWGNQVSRGPGPGRFGHAREVVTRSALGAAGARGLAAPEFDLIDVQRTGVPGSGVVNINGSRVVTRDDWLIGAHRDIYHDEIATLVGLAAGLLKGGPAGARPRPLSPFGRP